MLGVGRVEAIDGVLAHGAGDATVDPLVLVALALHEVLEEVQHLGHLREDEDAVAGVLQLAQHLGHELQLAAGLVHGIDLEEAGGRDGRLLRRGGEKVRVVGHLLQLHHHVEEGGLGAGLGPQRLEVVREDALVVLLLHRGQVGPHDELGL